MSLGSTRTSPRTIVKQKHFIDSHKGATALVCFALMHHFDQWDNPTAWVYTALHGTYGVLWVMKSTLFGDKTWEMRTPLWYGLVIWAALTLYWTAPYIICSRSLQMPMPWLGLCIMTYIIGVFFHFASDMQKHTLLSVRPGLITTGLWSRLRNPNYFGELLIYLGFVAIPLHWLPLTALGAMIGAFWIPRMNKKDASLSRYPEWPAYKARSKRFIPFVW